MPRVLVEHHYDMLREVKHQEMIPGGCPYGVTVSIWVQNFPFKSVGIVLFLTGCLWFFSIKIGYLSFPLPPPSLDIPALTIASFGTTGSLCHGIPCVQESEQSRIAVAKVKPSLRTDFLVSPRKYWAPRWQWKWVSRRRSLLNACCPLTRVRAPVSRLSPCLGTNCIDAIKLTALSRHKGAIRTLLIILANCNQVLKKYIKRTVYGRLLIIILRKQQPSKCLACFFELGFVISQPLFEFWKCPGACLLTDPERITWAHEVRWLFELG